MKPTFFIFLFISVLVVAEDWDTKFADVCKIDKFCKRLKADDGTWYRPKTEIVALLKNTDVQNEIKNASKKYDIDPTAVAGAIVAENSLNVGVKDSVQTWLASQMGITKIGTKSFSFGLGQISLPAAHEAEQYIAKIEKRAPRSDEELTKEIADPMGSIRVAAEIIRKVQDDYKAQGFDISKDPGVLTTLYNLGGSEQKARDAKAAGRLPQVNYFGLFVNKYTSEIQGAAKITTASVVPVAATPAAPVATVPSISAPVAKVADVAVAKTSKSTSPVPVVSKQTKNLVKYDTVTTAVPLLSAPLLCESKGREDYGQDVERDTKNSGYGAPVGALNKDESYSEVSRTLDCRSNVWKLVKGKEDKTGWVQEDQLEKVKSAKMDEANKCQPSKAELACKENVTKAVGDLAKSSNNPLEGMIFAKPISKAGEGKISFKNEDFRCGNRPPPEPDRPQYAGYAPQPKKPAESSKEIKQAAEDFNIFVNAQLQRMSKAVKLPIDQLKDPENPYASVASLLFSARENNQHCLRSLSSEEKNCRMDPRGYSDEYKKKIANFEYEKSPDIFKVMNFGNELQNIYYSNNAIRGVIGSAYQPDKDEVSVSTPEEVKESIADCNDRLKGLQEEGNKKQLEKMQKIQQKAQQQIQEQAQQNQAGGLNPNGTYKANTANPYGAYAGLGYYGSGTNPYGNSNSNRYNSNYSFGMYGVSGFETIQVASKATDEQIKKYFVEFIGLAKFCHARLNLLSTSAKKNRFSCTQAPKYIGSNAQLYTKEIMTKMYEDNPLQLVSEISEGSSNYISQSLVRELKGTQPQPQTTVPSYQRNDDYGASYCPNKTAEYIEDLVKNNPCIRHVYVPTRFLSNKLSSLDSKVIYRQFEEDGAYAIEVGDPTCKQP